VVSSVLFRRGQLSAAPYRRTGNSPAVRHGNYMAISNILTLLLLILSSPSLKQTIPTPCNKPIRKRESRVQQVLIPSATLLRDIP